MMSQGAFTRRFEKARTRRVKDVDDLRAAITKTRNRTRFSTNRREIAEAVAMMFNSNVMVKMTCEEPSADEFTGIVIERDRSGPGQPADRVHYFRDFNYAGFVQMRKDAVPEFYPREVMRAC